MDDPDYGDARRRELLYNWVNDKPTYRIRWKVIGLLLLMWTLCFLAWWFLGRS